jgi:uncharacterized membrane protein
MKWLQDVRASYWFLPTVLAVLAVVLAQLMQYLDHHKFLLTDAWRTTQVEGARSTLALISQSVIGVTGVMFSMTIVAVSFASGNFGPRLIGNFMRDRGNQLSLGILIATFVYSLLILRAIQSPYGPEGAHEAFVPHLSMLVALGLTGVSVLTMIYYVHHIPEIINVSNIAADLGARLRTAIEVRIDANLDEEPVANTDWPEPPAPRQIFLLNDGFLQTWDHARLRELATENGLHLELRSAAGSFITTFTPVLDVWSDKPLSDELESNIRDCFALGTVPTEQQNLLFIVEQLVEMIVRALSPGVNDPYTAINCLNWLYVGLITAANYKGGLTVQRQDRVRHPSLDLEKLFAASITEGLPYIKSDPMVCKHLDAMLNRLILETENAEAQLVAKKLRREVAPNLES